MIYQLRDYQQQASNAAVRFFHDTKSKKNAVMARPTMSLALYYQIVGRCIRPHPKKESAWLVDLCGNVRRFGRVEDLKLVDGGRGNWAVWSRGEQLTNVYL